MESFLGIVFGIGVLIFLCTQFKSKEEAPENDYVEVKAEIMKLEALPQAVTNQLLSSENVYYFSFLVLKKDEGGCCGASVREDYWIALTDKRFIYKTKIKDNTGNKLVEKNGIIPLDKISEIEVVYDKEDLGCASQNNTYELRIGSMGSTTIIPIPTEQKGFEIRKVYMELTEILKGNNSEDN